MLAHVSIGVRNIAATKKFYDAALQPLGYACLSAGAEYLGYGKKSVVFWISLAKRPVPADMESGLHFCFTAEKRKDVDAFYAAALKNGGRDNGAPGIRADYTQPYYAAFAHDPDGYRVEALCAKAE